MIKGKKTLGLMVLFYNHQKKKKKTNKQNKQNKTENKKQKQKQTNVSLFLIWKFYFKNLIYKLIKKFENQQGSAPIF